MNWIIFTLQLISWRTSICQWDSINIGSYKRSIIIQSNLSLEIQILSLIQILLLIIPFYISLVMITPHRRRRPSHAASLWMNRVAFWRLVWWMKNVQLGFQFLDKTFNLVSFKNFGIEIICLLHIKMRNNIFISLIFKHSSIK